MINLNINYANGSTKVVPFVFLEYNWYEENNIYFALDGDQLLDLGCEIDNVTTYKCPSKILNKCVHVCKSVGRFHFLLYTNKGIIIYYKSNNTFISDIEKFKYLKKWLRTKYNIKLWYGKIK